ncbi:MAG: hypothetical protein ACTHWH_17860 [Marinobacter sp.]
MLKVMNKANAGLLVVFSALALSACGGGGSSSSDGPDNSATELKPGVYNIGRIFSDGSSKEGLSLISPSGEFVSVLGRAAFGPLTFSGSGEFSGPIVEYTLNDTTEPLRGTVSGIVKSAKEADLTASKSDLSVSGVLLRRDEPSDLGVTLSRISANYSTDDSQSAITISSDGVVAGTDKTGCVFSGKVEIPDEAINVFEITYEAENCAEIPTENASAEDRNGTFSGLGTYIPSGESGEEILFYTRNDTVAWMFRGNK